MNESMLDKDKLKAIIYKYKGGVFEKKEYVFPVAMDDQYSVDYENIREYLGFNVMMMDTLSYEVYQKEGEQQLTHEYLVHLKFGYMTGDNEVSAQMYGVLILCPTFFELLNLMNLMSGYVLENSIASKIYKMSTDLYNIELAVKRIDENTKKG